MAPKKVIGRTVCGLLSCALFFVAAFPALGALQFDAFLGYDNILPEHSWFPISCEIYNDGAPFNADIQVSTGDFGEEQTRHFALDLPTGTRKRVFIPVFSSGGIWNVRLVDESGHVREERVLDQGHSLVNGLPLVAAVARTASGLPVFPELTDPSRSWRYSAARIQPDFLPDNPLALEGVDVLYISSEKAANFTVGQVNALLAWLQQGGHLVIGVDDVTDVNGTPWLRALLPCELSGSANVHCKKLQEWTRQTVPNASPGERGFTRRHYLNNSDDNRIGPDENIEDDANFGAQPLPVATGTIRDGSVVVSEDGVPLIIEAPNVRGRITALTFSPEREPFLSWKNRMWFWARVADIPTEQFQQRNGNVISSRLSSDGIFGAMIATKQVRKLPLGWLLVLLVAYLVVIGPLDQYWLKKINRQMLTWITFPCYVVLFSGLIYYIGHYLRAGELEWNELNIVDILPDGEQSVLRGQTYVSIYSPNNAQYELAGRQKFATLRGEATGGGFVGGQDASRAMIAQVGNQFEAKVFVPVWTSRLFVSDWVQPSVTPLSISASRDNNIWTVSVTNHLERTLTKGMVVLDQVTYDLGDLPPAQGKTYKFDSAKANWLGQFVANQQNNFRGAVQSYNNSFGNNTRFITDPAAASMAASFLSFLNDNGSQGWNTFGSPSPLDLSRFANADNAILLAWDEGEGLAQPLNQFEPRRMHRNTLLRLVTPLKTN